MHPAHRATRANQGRERGPGRGRDIARKYTSIHAHTRLFPRPENSRTWDKPSPLELVPASHEVHTPMLAPPDDVENVPAAHNVQSSPRPMAPELQVPGRHARH
jgi:hypothetical protein